MTTLQCREVQSRLRGWLFGEYPNPADAALELHVRDCARCQRALDDEAAVFVNLTNAEEGERESETERIRKAESLERNASLLQERHALLKQQRAEARSLVDELLRHPQERRLTMIANLGRFRSWGLCETLINQSETDRSSSPVQASELALLAVGVANALDRDFYRASLVNDLAAQSWTAVGASRAELTDLEGAAAAIEEAERYCSDGTMDPLLESDIAFVKATVRGAQGSFDESMELLEDAECIWRRFGASDTREDQLAAVRAKMLRAELLSKPHHERLQLVNREVRYHNPAACEVIIECAREAACDDAALAIEWGELAVLAASRLDSNQYRASELADTHALALVVLGNAKRAASDLVGAATSLSDAEAQLERGTGDPLKEAFYHHYLSSLRLFQRRLPEAIAHVDSAIATYRRIGDQHLAGRSLILKAVILHHDRDMEGAIRLDEMALELIDPHRDPRLQLAVLHNLALNLASHGEPERAHRVLAKARPMYDRFGDKISLIKLRWLEGNIARAADNRGFAEAAFVEAREAFLRRDMPYEAALVALELAALYLEQARTADVKRLVADMVPIFKALEVQPEALAALILFRKAVEREALTVTLVHEVASFLEKACHNPGLRFRSPSG